TVSHPQIAVTVPFAYNRIQVQRSILADHSDARPVWTMDGSNFIAVVSGAIRWDDVGVPWDVPVWYRVIGFRDADRRSVSSAWAQWWASPYSAPGGVAMGLSSFSPNVVLWYSPADPSDLQMKWQSLGNNGTAQLHGRDYQVAIKEPEWRGLSVSVLVVV